MWSDCKINYHTKVKVCDLVVRMIVTVYLGVVHMIDLEVHAIG